MTAQFKLVPNPTFAVDVEINIPGSEPGQMTITFKHKRQSELAKIAKDRTNGDLLSLLIDGWSLEEPFNRKNLDILLDNYPQAVPAILNSYYNSIYGAREKN